MLYTNFNSYALDRIPSTAKRVLDIGCGTGALGREIKKGKSCEVVGITYSGEEAELAKQYLDCVLVKDMNHYDVREAGRFDCVICSHVLEHLNQPEKLLHSIHDILEPGGKLIIVLPNVLFWKQRWLFMRGEFKYTDEGLLDRTHFRFYDWEAANALVRDCGFAPREAFVDGMISLPLARKLFPQTCRRIDLFLARTFPGLFGFQFVFNCTSSN